MKRLKRKLALYLAIFLIAPAVTGLAPNTGITAAAAPEDHIRWVDGNTSGESMTAITVEAKQKFYIGDHIYVGAWYYFETSGTGSMFDLTYTSSDPTVATVNAKGLVTTKKKGSTTITASYKGESIVCRLTVVAAGKLGTTKKYASLVSAAKTMDKNTPATYSKDSLYKVATALAAYYKKYEKFHKPKDGVSISGFLNQGYFTTEKLVAPMAGRYRTLLNMHDKGMYYDLGVNPLGTWSALKVNATKMTVYSSKNSSKKNTCEITLNRELTSDEILYLQLENSCDWGGTYSVPAKNKAKFYVYLYDSKTNKAIKGTATATAGKNKFTVKASKNLTKGHKYYIGQYLTDPEWASETWHNGISAVAKK